MYIFFSVRVCFDLKFDFICYGRGE